VFALAAIPASMVLISWIPAPFYHGWMAGNAPGLRSFLQGYFLTAWTAYPQLFACQTLAAVVFCCGAALWLCRPDPFGHPGARLRRHPFAVLVVAYGAWAGLSWFWSAWPFGTLAYFMRELPFYVLAIALALVCVRRARWRTAAILFALSASAQAAIQFAAIVTTATTVGVTYREAFLSTAVAYGNPNFGCAIQITAMLVALALLVDCVRRVRSGERLHQRTVLLLAVLLGALPILVVVFIAAASLAGKLAALAAFGAFGLAILPLPRKGAIVGAVAALCAAVVIVGLASSSLRIRAMRSLLSPRNTTSLRVVDWLAAKELYLRRPFHGWGMGTFPATHARYHPPLARKLPLTSNRRTTHPHNEYVRIAADQGCIGLFLYLGILGYAFVVSRNRLRAEAGSTGAFGWALWAGALGFAVQSAFGKAPMYWSFSGPMWLLLGILASAAHWPEEEANGGNTPAGPEQARSGCRAGGLIVLCLLCTGACWLWWEWGARAYDSAIVMSRARWLQKNMGDREEGPARFEEFRFRIAQARDRCLWADEILHADYGTGWYLTRHDQWGEASAILENLQAVAPEFLRTRLFLAECYMGMGQRERAREELLAFLERDPHDLGAYRLLVRLDGNRVLAEALLSEHVLSRLHQPEDWVVENYPTADEIMLLLDMQLRLGKLQEARQVFLLARTFFVQADVSWRVNVDGVVRRMAKLYAERGEDHLAGAIRRLMPEAWEDAPRQS
jgi:O-antigen ligase